MCPLFGGGFTVNRFSVLDLLIKLPLTLRLNYYCCLNILQSYEQAFEQIKDATGITDIDKLVTKFIEGEYVLFQPFLPTEFILCIIF